MTVTDAGPRAPATPAARGLSGEGRPLEAGARDLLATAFARDFSAVRIHAGPEAAEANRDLGSLAYTVGNDIAFAAGSYDPLTRSGRSLIAHELAHVAQHGGRAYAPNFLLTDHTGHAPAADHRLEAQAHLAAHLAGSGLRLPPSWSWARADRPFLGRASASAAAQAAFAPVTPSGPGAGWRAPPAPYDVTYGSGTRTIAEEQWNEDDPASATVNMGEFVVPAKKGPWAQEYDRIAKAGGLKATITVNSGRIRSEMWQQRAPTPELRRNWLLRVGWPAAKAAQWWEDAGGLPGSGGFDPRTNAGPAQIDHIVELQLGGSNVPENLAPHTGPDNEASGREIWRMLRGAGQDVATNFARRPQGRRLTSLTLFFSSARQDGAYDDVSALAALPGPGATRDTALSGRRGRAGKALQVHNTAVADNTARTRPGPQDLDEQATAVAALPEFPISSLTNTATLRVPATPGEQADLIENSEIPQNHAARELISSLVLEKLERPRSGRALPVVTAWLNSPRHPVREGTRIPLNIQKEKDQELPFAVHPGGVLRLKKAENVDFTFDGLSAGRMRFSSDDAGGLTGHGTLTPSVPLLRRVPITLDWDRNGLRGSIQAPTDKLSLPPFRITESALTVTIAPTLSAGGHVAFELGRIAQGRIEAGVDTRGFFARGTMTATIPGLDAAQGEVAYRPETGLTGFVVVRASRPSGIIRSGEVRLDFTPRGWAVGGQVDAMLPGNNPAQFTVRQTGERVVYTGRTTLRVPPLRPVDVDVRYDGEHLSGSARTTFTLLGANGEMELGYRDGRFSGNGAVMLQRGRFSGRLEANLDNDGVITGRGTGSIEIKPGLVGTIGIEYGRDRRLRTTGELRFPPYTFLQPRGARRQLFQHSLPDIPIFAIPLGIGSVGLVARIGGGLAVRYQFGPGQIRDMIIQATLYPLEDDMQAQLTARARLVLPAEAGLELSVRAGIGASVAFASATGGITVTGGLLLRGGLDAAAELTYGGGLLTFDANARISVQPVLTLRIEADIMIEAPAAGPWRWPYELASYSYPTGLEFGMVAPFHYRSDQPLQLPSVSDIQWIVPQIDVSALALQLAGQVRRGMTQA